MDKCAESIIEIVKNCLFEDLFDKTPFEHNSSRDFLSILEEDFKYDIKKLGLIKEDEVFYLKKVVNLFGEYSEDVPSKNPNKSYYDGFYFD